jgi:hypothetical protein
MIASAALLAVSAASCGIERKGGATGGRGPISHAGEQESPFVPVQLVVHPLTRVVRGTAAGDDRVELHLELRDRWEDSVKWLGDVVIELFRESPPIANASSGGEQVKRWKVELTDAEANVKAYDRVTRTYRLTLVDLPSDKGKSGVWKLEARWMLPEGRTLVATQRLE